MYIVQVREDINKREPSGIGSLVMLGLTPNKTDWRDHYNGNFEELKEAKEFATKLISSSIKTANNVRIVKVIATFEAQVVIKDN